MKTSDKNREESQAAAEEKDTFWRALGRPFRRVPEHISRSNRIQFSYMTGEDELVSSKNKLVRCGTLPRFDIESEGVDG